MERRTFSHKSLAVPFLPTTIAEGHYLQAPEIIIERPQSGETHAGKVLAAIQPHSDDIPIFSGGTVAKLIKLIMSLDLKAMKLNPLLFAVLILGFSCSKKISSHGPDPAPDKKEVLILISFDGFRYDYFEKANTPAMDQLISEGVRAEGLIPVFPSKTFPNHYSQVTGLYPQNHGIVGNTMFDPEFDEVFKLSNGATAEGKWYGGEPIWVTAEKQGCKAATFFWPGSEAEINGKRPTYYKKFDAKVPYSTRTQQVLQWLDLPSESRPDFITLYFESPDLEGHSEGPNSPGVIESVERMDRQIRDLIDGIESQRKTEQVNLILVSDHGMAQLSRDKVIFLDDYIDLNDVWPINRSPIAELLPDNGKEEAVFQALSGAHTNMRVYKKGDLPEELHYNTHRRIPPIICIADEGWSISDRAYFNSRPNAFTGGNHGFDPKHKSMWGIFLAKGPAFKRSRQIPAFKNIHLYELMCTILSIEPAANDGEKGVLLEILRQ